MAGISSLGVGSGIDIRSLVDQLVAAERAPVQTRLDRRETTLQAELSSFGLLKSALSDFSGAVKALSDASAFRSATATSDDADVVEVGGSASVSRAATLGIQVDSLADAQSVASMAFAGAAADVGSGTLTFRFGTVEDDGNGLVTGFTQNPERATATVRIPAGSSSLADVRDAVNEADIGIRASIINDGVGDRLVFVAEDTGAANGFLVDVSDDDGVLDDAAGLSRLALDTANSNLELNRAGADAQLVVDGLAVTRAGNEIDDLLEGATLTLRGTSMVPVDVHVEPDTAQAKKLVTGFVEAYNVLQEQIDSLAGYDAESQQGGVLQGNALVRSVESNVRRLVTAQLDALDGRGVRALADIGIRTTRDGTLEIDDALLSERLAEDVDGVAALFGTTGIIDGSGLRYESSRSETRPGGYAVSVTQLAERAAITGSAVAAASEGSPVAVATGSDVIELTVDGIASGAIALTQGSYTSGAALAAELQARINGSDALRDAGYSVTVSFDDTANTFSITSDRYGSESTVEITAMDAGLGAVYGLSVGQLDAGMDVAGSIGGVAAEGFGRYLTGQTGDADGLKVEITGGVVGDLGRVTFSRGVSALLESTLDGFLRSDGLFNGATKRLRDNIEDIGDERVALDDRLERLQSRLLAQFSAMDAMVAQLNQTSTFLTSQLAGLESLARNSGRRRESS